MQFTLIRSTNHSTLRSANYSLKNNKTQELDLILINYFELTDIFIMIYFSVHTFFTNKESIAYN